MSGHIAAFSGAEAFVANAVHKDMADLDFGSGDVNAVVANVNKGRVGYRSGAKVTVKGICIDILE